MVRFSLQQMEKHYSALLSVIKFSRVFTCFFTFSKSRSLSVMQSRTVLNEIHESVCIYLPNVKNEYKRLRENPRCNAIISIKWTQYWGV